MGYFILKKNILKERIRKYLYALLSVSLLYVLTFSMKGCEQDFIQPGNFVRFPDAVEVEMNAAGCYNTSCHNNEDAAGGLNLEDWEKAMNGTINGAIFIPYSGFWSHFIAIINADTAIAPVKSLLNPQLDQFHKLPNEKVTFFMNYIDQGAKSINNDVAFTNVSKKLFITNQGVDMLAVIDAERQLVTRLVKLDNSQQLKAPHYIAADPQNRYLYITLISGGEVLKVNANYPYNVIGSANVGINPAHVAISPDGNAGYVSNFNSSGSERDIRRFNTNTMQVDGIVTDVRLTASHGIVLSSDGQFLYAASQFGEWIFKINTSTFEIENDAPMSPAVPPNGFGTGSMKPYDLKISPDGSLLFISCLGPSNSQVNSIVKVYNTSDLSFVQDIEVGRSPLLMEITPNGQQLWVCNKNSNSVSVIDIATLANIVTIPDVGIQPHGVVFSSDGQFAFLSNESLLGFSGHHPLVGSTSIGVNTIIRTATYTLEDRVMETATFPAGILIME